MTTFLFFNDLHDIAVFSTSISERWGKMIGGTMAKNQMMIKLTIEQYLYVIACSGEIELSNHLSIELKESTP